ncbi:hypothetical protein C8R46DRAFT_1357258 [Mycena filopes]|nr:hypothetical protein C8R46DRAFT_1357258 [Mycena filopes]
MSVALSPEPLATQLARAQLDELFTSDPAPYPSWAMKILSQLSETELDQYAYTGSSMWRQLLLTVLAEKAGNLSTHDQTEFGMHLAQHNQNLSELARKLGVWKWTGSRTGCQAMGIALQILIPKRFDTAFAESWVAALISPALEMAREYNTPRLAALPRQPVSRYNGSRTHQALYAMADQAEAAAAHELDEKCEPTANGSSASADSVTIAAPLRPPTANATSPMASLQQFKDEDEQQGPTPGGSGADTDAGTARLPAASASINGRPIAGRPRRSLLSRLGPTPSNPPTQSPSTGHHTHTVQNSTLRAAASFYPQPSFVVDMLTSLSLSFTSVYEGGHVAGRIVLEMPK